MTFDSKKVLAVVSPGSSSLTMRSKNAIPCRAGDVFKGNGAMQLAVGTTLDTFQAKMEFFDDVGTSLGTFPVSANYSITAALADTTLPNYTAGNARWMSTEAFRAVAPKNAASVKLLIFLSNPNGTVYLSRLRLFRG